MATNHNQLLLDIETRDAFGHPQHPDYGVPTGGVPRPVFISKAVITKAALATQVSGSHYKTLKIQPIEYIHANGLPFAEGSIIKYVTRWRNKGGVTDLEKAKHFIDLLISLEAKNKD